jgi:hypothetical protein
MSNELGLLLRTITERIEPARLLERVTGGPADDWQRDLLAVEEGDTAMVLASRRIGKSTTVGVLAAQELAQPEHTVIILSPTLSQSQLLFAKISRVWELIGLPIQNKRRTMTELHLANGSSVVCVPAGQDGESARGYGIKNGLLAYDEAAFIPDKVFGATMPIAEDNCKTVLISTPGGKSGKAFQMWTDHDQYPEIKRIRACSLDLPRMAKTVERARRNLAKVEFDVEHGLRWMGRGTPFFDADTITSAFTDTPELKLGNLFHGIS